MASFNESRPFSSRSFELREWRFFFVTIVPGFVASLYIHVVVSDIHYFCASIHLRSRMVDLPKCARVVIMVLIRTL
jgi:hypothetical protein